MRKWLKIKGEMIKKKGEKSCVIDRDRQYSRFFSFTADSFTMRQISPNENETKFCCKRVRNSLRSLIQIKLEV